MRDPRKNTGPAKHDGVSSQRSGKQTSTKNDQTQLGRLGARVGNEEFRDRIRSGNSSRDAMLEHLCDRLKTIHQVQHRETDAMGHLSRRKSWSSIADSHKTEITKPNPTRWAEVARLYKEAAMQLCRGSVGRGAEILDRAMNAEERAFDALTTLVDTDDIEEHEIQSGHAWEVGLFQVCAPCELPSEVSLADTIQGIPHHMPDPPVRKRMRDPWWTEDEEEEEADDAGGS